jgi:mRNA interferase MazF
MTEYYKDFENWHKVKQSLNKREMEVDLSDESKLRNGEIRWANIGVNIGSEIDGKGNIFTRPVIVLHLIGKNSALVVPLSTKVEQRAGYFYIEVRGERVCYCINQIKVISVKRLQERISKLTSDKILEVKNNLKKFYSL